LQEDTPPPRSPGSVTPDLTTGLGSRALRFTILILVARILSRLLALVAVVAIGNALGDSRFGQMQTAVTYTALVGAITDVGFTALYVREGAREPHNLTRYFNNVASIKLFLVAISLPLLALSLAVPLTAADTAISTKLTLAAAHLIAGAIIIPTVAKRLSRLR